MNRLLGPDGDVLPASEGALVYFAFYLASTVGHGTIKLHLGAVRNLQLYWVQWHYAVSWATRADSVFVANQYPSGALGHSARIAVMVESPGFSVGSGPPLTLAFFAFLRCSELTYVGLRKFRPLFDLTTDSIAHHPSLARPHVMSVQLKSSKAYKFRKGNLLP